MDEFLEYENGEYGDGILLDEYNGEFSLISAKTGSDGNIYKRWMFPQGAERKPIDKSLPWKIKLGSREEAVKILQHFLSKLGGNVIQLPATGGQKALF